MSKPERDFKAQEKERLDKIDDVKNADLFNTFMATKVKKPKEDKK